MQQHIFTVQGMTCGHCERAVTQAIQNVDAQAAVSIDRESGQVAVQSALPREALTRAITDEGYAVVN